jgi:uncharacterized protein YuzE
MNFWDSIIAGLGSGLNKHWVEQPCGLSQHMTGGHHMKISYDSEVDALSITFRETTVTTKHLGEGIAADYDADGKLAGIEILDAIKRFGGKETLRQVVIEGLGPTQTS